MRPDKDLESALMDCAKPISQGIDSSKASQSLCHSSPLIYHVLWTGGFDSSFRMVQLSKCNVVVQPYYLEDSKRQSTEHELKAIADMTEDIKEHPETRCKILPLITCNTDSVKRDETITEAYNRLREATSIGSQYDWLARFSKEHGNAVELCLEQEFESKAWRCIQKYGSVIEETDGCISHCIIDRDKSSADLVTVFGWFRFPLPLFRMSKLETLKEFKKLGFGRMVSKTWFCHTPINGVPCGICNPCKSTIAAGMRFRLPAEALERYYKHRNKFLSAYYRAKRHIVR